jgi:hypothetical protein
MGMVLAENTGGERQDLAPGRNEVPVRANGLRRLLNRRTLVLALLFAVVIFYGIWASFLLMIHTGTIEERLRGDFLAYYAGSSLALDGDPAAAYDKQRVLVEQVNIHGDDQQRTYAWLYPPTFFFFVLPLALAPAVLALLAWFTVTGALALSALRRISSDRAVLLLAVAFPATFWNFVIGQNGLLTAGLLAWGLLLLRDRPLLGGGLLGLLIYKPQFFPLIPIALWAGGRRSASIVCLAAACVLCLASLLVFGLESWEGFVSAATGRGDLIYSSDPGATVPRMQSVTGLLIAIGAAPFVVQLAQGVVGFACAASVFWLWRREYVADEYKFAGLALAILLASPYSYHYDLTVMGLAALWLGLSFLREGWSQADKGVVLGLAWLTPLLTLLSGNLLGVTLGPFVLLALVAVLLSHVKSVRDRRLSKGPMAGLIQGT